MTRAPVFLALSTIAGLMVSPASGAGLEARPEVGPVAPRLAIETVRYKGRSALRVRDRPRSGECCLVAVPSGGFHDGVIEAWVAGQPNEGASQTARGFVGIAFRVAADRDRYEAFYIRPTNGRADDQLRRNHATQYISEPTYPWERLRAETPGQYESYTDLETGAWTHLRIEVAGNRARLFVNDSPQPTLIVNDLKLGADAVGGVGLWVGDETDGYFSDVQVTKTGK